MPTPHVLYQMLELLKLSRLPFVGSPAQSHSYEPLNAVEEDQHPDKLSPPTKTEQTSTKRRAGVVIIMVVASFLALLGVVALVRASYLEHRAATSSASASSAKVPQYFQTSPEIYAGGFFMSCEQYSPLANR